MMGGLLICLFSASFVCVVNIFIKRNTFTVVVLRMMLLMLMMMCVGMCWLLSNVHHDKRRSKVVLAHYFRKVELVTDIDVYRTDR